MFLVRWRIKYALNPDYLCLFTKFFRLILLFKNNNLQSIIFSFHKNLLRYGKCFGIAFICSDKAKTLLTVCGEFNMLMTILMLALAVNCGSFMGIILHSYSSNN